MKKKKNKSFSKINISVLVSDEANGLDFFKGYWNPLMFFEQQFENLDINFNFIRKLDDRAFNSDIIFLSSRYFKKKDQYIDESYFLTFELLKKNKIKLIWFDLRDSAGTTQFEVLPYVDLYFKKQMYKNKSSYYADLYGGREFSDYYNKRFRIKDDNPYKSEKLKKKYEKKIHLSWNLGVKLFDAGYKNFFQRGLELSKYKLIKNFSSISYRKLLFLEPEHRREIDFICTYSVTIPRNSVRFQRELFKEKNYKIKNSILFEKISPSKYLNYLKKCKLILSLYGWGEVCYKEFEATVAGASFIMPNMSNILTWPNLYIPGETYLPIDWDLKNFEEIYYKLLDDDQLRLELVNNAQKTLESVHKKTGEKYFESLLKKIIKK